MYKVCRVIENGELGLINDKKVVVVESPIILTQCCGLDSIMASLLPNENAFFLTQQRELLAGNPFGDYSNAIFVWNYEYFTSQPSAEAIIIHEIGHINDGRTFDLLQAVPTDDMMDAEFIADKHAVENGHKEGMIHFLKALIELAKVNPLLSDEYVQSIEQRLVRVEG